MQILTWFRRRSFERSLRKFMLDYFRVWGRPETEAEKALFVKIVSAFVMFNGWELTDEAFKKFNELGARGED